MEERQKEEGDIAKLDKHKRGWGKSWGCMKTKGERESRGRQLANPLRGRQGTNRTLTWGRTHFLNLTSVDYSILTKSTWPSCFLSLNNNGFKLHITCHEQKLAAEEPNILCLRSCWRTKPREKKKKLVRISLLWERMLGSSWCHRKVNSYREGPQPSLAMCVMIYILIFTSLVFIFIMFYSIKVKSKLY